MENRLTSKIARRTLCRLDSSADLSAGFSFAVSEATLAPTASLPIHPAVPEPPPRS